MKDKKAEKVKQKGLFDEFQDKSKVMASEIDKLQKENETLKEQIEALRDTESGIKKKFTRILDRF